MRSERVRNGDITLDVAVAGQEDLPTVLFVNAVGMENRLLEGLARQFLRSGMNLVTWELRGSPGPCAERQVTLEEHTEDALAVVDALGLTRVHVAGWCTGASIALFVAHALEERALSFTSIDGALLFDGVPGAPVGNAVFDMCAQIAADTDRAAYFHDVVRPRGNEGAALGVQDEALVRMLTLPYRQGREELTRFAWGISATCDYDPAAACARLSVPALFIARQDDAMVGHRNSRRAAALVEGARLHVAGSGGHYALFTDPAETAATMAAFVLKDSAPA
ncbi:alpha/beta fold hydrolase [Streptomyces sp. NPDC006704]|uniref:alpha/beta fold hydrolase n=1 Tax=Streptomyces sp. NPDC006704 TaxID=3364760 RepID=UPI00368C2EE1